MVASNLHEDLDTPPAIPAFSSTPRRPHSPSLATVISGAATAFAKALGENSQQDKEGSNVSGTSIGVSPGKAVDLRMKNYQQLRYIQQLFEDGILSEAEYIEQKQRILALLGKL